MTATITCQELNKRLADGGALRVVDVLPPEVYAARHLPGARNACVYEIVFLKGVAELAPDPATPLVLYDATGTTMAAATAREKLLEAGYRDVRVLSGGLAGWCAAGFPVEPAADPPPEPVLRDGTYRLDPSASVLEWIGRNFNNRHYGRIPFSGGELVIAAGELQRGELTLDMTGITNLDLQDETYRRMLVHHLKSDDFFAVDRYPVAGIRISGWQRIAGATPGAPDHTVEGELTIKGITRRIAFPAAVAPQEDGSLKAQAAFDIDRTAWNIAYGSGKLFEKLGMHLVHDRIDIELFIVARRSG
ncbi:YceI family protein [Geobacter sp. AOG1]|uniref:YceI family protein n=1 Tax=Geobacter sp. AOG1 TaxID=1566346 RepID=UPI001CC51FFE|nr:YceI family protein [Geobacter sp. AOG1]GFE57117.1 sulfurtransferase [Geobacter sp. AOG1]